MQKPDGVYDNENVDGEIGDQASDTKNLDYFRYLHESTIHTLEETQGINELQPNQDIKIEFECKNEKPHLNLSIPYKLNEGILEFQPNQEIKIEFECKDENPIVNSFGPDKLNDQYQDVKISGNFATHSSIKIESESIVNKEFLSNGIKTIDISSGNKLNISNWI
ncbi:hypothetical protein TKK_0006493 [Trichogramma kaykai]